jgi:hypothetical protein
MRARHIANERKRDAEVAFDSPSGKKTTSMVMKDGREKTNVKVIKTLMSDQMLKDQHKGDMIKLGEALIAGTRSSTWRSPGASSKKPCACGFRRTTKPATG